MPTTINGIGTTYYGKKNLSTRTDVCEHCSRRGELQSYQTRLWFVVLFIPVIPLGRRQIIDYCPHCTRHRRMDIEQWAEFTRTVLDESRQRMADNPADPEAALDCLSCLGWMGQAAEADRLAERLSKNFPDHAEVQMAVGSWYEMTGRNDQADVAFLSALKADPENTDARRAVGIYLLEKGQLAKARELLAFMEEAGPHQDPAVLILLARAHQDAAQHAEALEVFSKAAAAAPELARDRGFRKLVGASERAVPESRPILPAVPIYRRRAPWVIGVLAAALGGAAGVNYYIAAHRTVHVVNGLRVPISVRFDGGSPVTVGAGQRREVTLAEGAHRAWVSAAGLAPQTERFTLAAGYFERYFDDPTFIFNPGGAAVILWEEAFYSDLPSRPENNCRFHLGRSFLSFQGIDYAFGEFPEKIRVERSPGAVFGRTRVAMLPWPPSAVLALGELSPPTDDKMRFAESHLRADPDDKTLLGAYCALAVEDQRQGRCRDFLAGGLKARPARVEWHRAYQNVSRQTPHAEGMIQEYRRLVAAEPDNADILYLMGRVTPDSGAAMACFDKAIAADADNPYPWYAKSVHLKSAGRFAEAKACCAKALARRGDDPEVRAQWYDVRFALGEHKALTEEVRRKIRREPLAIEHRIQLPELLAAQEDLHAARREHEAFAEATKKEWLGDPFQRALLARIELLYLEKDFEGLLKACGSLNDKRLAREIAFQAYLELAQPEKAAEAIGRSTAAQAGYRSLLLSIACALTGESQKARTWRERAAAQLARLRGESGRVADLLKKGGDVSVEELTAVVTIPAYKAALLVALAESAPGKKAELLALAEKLNYRRLFPHHFLARAVQAMRQQP